MTALQNVVLVHGGFVDGSGWRGVYDALTADGLNVSVVQNQTLSLESDVETTRQVLDAQDGPTILVGHSYGGVVITEAGRHERVAGLVYIAAFAPDAGESVNTLIADPRPGAPVPPILPPVEGFLFLDREQFAASFAADLPAADAAFMGDSQVPWGVEALNGAVAEPAWRSKPTWYLVASDDHMIPPPAQRAMARGPARASSRRRPCRSHGWREPVDLRLAAPRDGRSDRARRPARARGDAADGLTTPEPLRAPARRRRPAGRAGPLRARLGLRGRRLRLPVDRAAEPGALEHLERQQRALHARRRDVDPEQLEDERAVELQQVGDRHALDLVGRHRRRRLADRAAVAVEADVLDRAVAGDAEHHAQLIAAQRVRVLELEVRRLHHAPVVRALVVVEDLLAIEIIHQSAKTSLTRSSPASSRSTSSRVLCTANDARLVAPTPKRFMSGCAQWWPARMQTPCAPRISATSCGCTPSTVNETSAPRSAASSGPWIATPGTAVRRSIAYAARSCSCSRTASIPIDDRKSTAAPRPIASAMFDVPASNFVGVVAKRVPCSSETDAIMCPPLMNGGIASRSSRRPWSTPMPVGP